MAHRIEQYDTALLGILQNEGNIGGFLDAVLGFLYRRFEEIHPFLINYTVETICNCQNRSRNDISYSTPSVKDIWNHATWSVQAFKLAARFDHLNNII